LRGGFCTLPRDKHVPGGLSVEDYATLRRLLDLIKASADPNAGPAEVFGGSVAGVLRHARFWIVYRPFEICGWTF
jgi:hypothetical protein